MVFVLILAVGVVAAAVFGLTGLARQGAQRRRAEGAAGRVRAALAAGGPDGIRDLAHGVDGLSAGAAIALVQACRASGSSDIVPILVAALRHPAAGADAAQALIDLGSPGLRAVWQAVSAGNNAPAYHAFLCRHPDWLFERLLETPDPVRHAALWRDAGLLARLELLRGSDALNALRAESILAALRSPAA